jgi:hypothetical protein
MELRPGGLLSFMVPSGWEDKDERSMLGTWLRLVEDAWRGLVDEGVVEARFFEDVNIPRKSAQEFATRLDWVSRH